MIRPPVFAALGYYPHTAIGRSEACMFTVQKDDSLVLEKAFWVGKKLGVLQSKGADNLFLQVL